jgi:hypothetical protein
MGNANSGLTVFEYRPDSKHQCPHGQKIVNRHDLFLLYRQTDSMMRMTEPKQILLSFVNKHANDEERGDATERLGIAEKRESAFYLL